MLIFIPSIAIVLTATKVLTAIAATGGTVLAAKALYDSGRRIGHAEGLRAYPDDIKAMRDRLDEMESGV